MRNGKMTTREKIVMIASVIVISVILIAMAIYQNEKTKEASATYSARKEELMTRQQQLSFMIEQLNSTLQADLNRQETLAAQLSNLTNEKITLQQAKIITPAPAPVPAPAPKPTPIRVTRAS
jgi:hypothetical protein